MLYLPGVMHQRRLTTAYRWMHAWRAFTGAPAMRNALVCIALLALAPRALEAHEIPQRVAVLGYVRPDGTRVDLLVRVPLEAMRDIEFPLRPDG